MSFRKLPRNLPHSFRDLGGLHVLTCKLNTLPQLHQLLPFDYELELHEMPDKLESELLSGFKTPAERLHSDYAKNSN